MNKQSTRQIGKELENLIVAYFLEIDPTTRLSKASGALLDVADVVTRGFYIEAKKRSSQSLTIEKKVWRKLNNKIPIGSPKIPLLIMQNIDKDTFVVLNIKDFINILKERKNV